ncbi:AMP-binding protein [Pseudomonas resinovorans]|uniref:AMP-binding protein n=1 Tax=Metapseudomonas resinovorans TaxID=53412 RepID=A0ABT4Y2U5_METRE|nr:AMP-binding protein [Pseudomonas resinovorans]MDA8483168.1 AMP-binding protein [Pseudomonas resinovorans]
MSRPIPTTVYELLQASSTAFADRTALTYIHELGADIGGQDLSYGAFFAQLNRSARLLLDLAGGRKPVITLLLPNIPQSQCLLWAAASVGIANPINPLLNEEALASLMEKAGTDLVVALGPVPGSDLWQKAVSAAQRLSKPPRCVSVLVPGGELFYDRLQQDYSGDLLPPALLPQPEDIAAYFHTGGTTGLPKLARQTHANQVAAACAYRARMAAGPEDVALNGLPIFHVAGALVNSLGGLASGLRMLLPTLGGFRNPEVIRQHWRLVEHYGITLSGGIPTSVAAMLEVPIDGHDISRLRFMLSGGAPVPAALCEKVKALTGLELYQAYGMTECTGVIALPNLEHPAIPGSAGHVAAPIEVKIDGGEICVRGPTVFAGYLGQERPPLEDGWLRSGDLGRLDEEGNLYITGRAKDLIIRSGHNIDPALIENCLESHPAVSMAAAVGMPDEYAGELPVAFVQLRQGQAVSADELQQYAFEHIAERPACPKRVFVVDALPVTVVGKIFKHTLRELAAASVYRERVGGECPALACEVAQEADGTLWISLTEVPEGQRAFCVERAEALGLRVRELVIAPACA